MLPVRASLIVRAISTPVLSPFSRRSLGTVDAEEIKGLSIFFKAISSSEVDDNLIDRMEFQKALGFKERYVPVPHALGVFPTARGVLSPLTPRCVRTPHRWFFAKEAAAREGKEACARARGRGGGGGGGQRF
jgi:hypothetical protein